MRTNRLTQLALPLVLVSLGAACSTPDLSEYEPRTGLITGTIFYPGGTARGNVVVVLFRADNPPPPQGSGTPVNLVIVPKKEIFHDIAEGVPGDFAAPFTMPTVAAGTYQIRAFLDADGDFNPTHDLLAQPTAGDVGGGHVDLVTQEFLPIEVANDRVTPQVTVTLGLNYPVERPAFEHVLTTSIAVPLAAPTTIILRSRPITRAPLRMQPAKTAFLVQYMDLDGDGAPDDSNGDHLPDVFPRVVLRKLGADASQPTVIVPGIIDPLPYMDALAARGAAITTELHVIIPPVAVERSAAGDRILPAIPPGDYETIVISGTGQTWTVPNDLDTDLPVSTTSTTGAMADPTQSVVFKMVDGPALPTGKIEGTVRVASDSRADTYIVAFDVRNPPPPVGTGRPVALVTVPQASFTPVAGAPTTIEAPFVLAGLRNGTYLVRGFADVDRTFSPLVDLLAQPSAKDVGGASTPAQVTVTGGATASNVVVELAQPVLFDRPVVEFPMMSIPRTSFPAAIQLDSHPLAFYGATAETSRIPVALGAGDADGDNLPDLLPRVLLTRMTDGGLDARVTPDDPASIVIPGIIDPLPFLTALARGVPAVPASSLRVILPPVAVKLGTDGSRQLLSPPPAGRYRVNVLSATGQTWSVPSTLDVALGRVGTPLEDETQARFVSITDSPVAGGAITGTVNLVGFAPPEGDFSVVVLAFDAARPPPPLGSGRPVASAILAKAAFAGGTSAPYALGGLATGSYQVRAFLDANDDFVPWFDTRNQPDAGDVGGGYLLLPQPVLGTIDVDALAAPVVGKDVTISPLAAYATDRPIFAFEGPAPSFNPSSGPISVQLRALTEQSDVLHQRGTFPVSWRDLDGNGVADDVNADGVPEVFPIVVAELLDPMDDTNLTPSSDHILIPGIVSPAQFAGTSFPLGDPTDVHTTVQTSTISVIFPPVALDAGGSRLTPPAGRYRVTVINPKGQTWSVPNELQRAAGSGLVATQSGVLTVTR